MAILTRSFDDREPTPAMILGRISIIVNLLKLGGVEQGVHSLNLNARQGRKATTSLLGVLMIRRNH